MKRGIYLVANFGSQKFCENLIYSIRQSGCTLPIRLIHFGGKEIDSPCVLKEVEMVRFENFPDKAKEFILNLRSVLTDCPLGYLFRFLGWFSDWDEFLYSDNDIVALCNWENLFDHLSSYDLVHADEEYTTKGIFNYNKPELVKSLFGGLALESAITAGHIVVKRNSKMIEDINSAVEWFRKNPGIPKKHDQSLLHIASLLGRWNVLNLCKPPHSWLSSWAGDYKNPLQIIQQIQLKDSQISHIHYSGGTPHGNRPIEDLILSSSTENERLRKLILVGIKKLSKVMYLNSQKKRIINKFKRTFKY
jgi:hypothetical protein